MLGWTINGNVYISHMNTVEELEAAKTELQEKCPWLKVERGNMFMHNDSFKK